MSEELKPCRNLNCSHKLPPFVVEESGLVVCPSCASQGILDVWQTDNARESALRAENEQLRRERDALDALVEALERQADFAAQSARFALDSSWENEQYRGICQTTQSARAELDAVREAADE